VLHDPNQESANNVDDHNDDACDGVATHEFRRSVHRTVEIRLLLDLLAAAFGVGLADQTGVQVSINRHLLAGQRIKRKPGADLGDSPSPFGDHRKVDDGQNDENNDSDDIISTDQKFAKRLNYLAGGVWPRVSLEQDNTCGCDVQTQAQQRGQQQEGREGHKLQNFPNPHGGNQHRDRNADVQDKKQVQ
jgi:hypothetical protein